MSTIGNSAFSGCTGLRSATIPASVNSIGSKAFYNCNELVITCPEGSAAERYADNNHIEVAGRTTATTTTMSDSENND